MTRPDRRALIVAGMHRSGTSAITRVLSLMGADLPARIHAAAPDNVAGFWEPIEVVQTHDMLLEAVGSTWDDVSAIDRRWFDTPTARGYEDRLLAALEANYGDSALFVLKDPRICRLLPLWLRTLARAEVKPSFVIPIRHPTEVVDSLRRRNGFSASKSLLLWLRHVLEAERETRAHPRAFITYDRLLQDWRSVTARIAEELALSLSASHRSSFEIERFLSPDLRHHVQSGDAVCSAASVAPLTEQVYAVVRRLARSAADAAPSDLDLLDAIGGELDRSDAAYGPLLTEAHMHVAQARTDVVEAQSALRRRTTELELELREEHERGLAYRDQIEELAAALTQADAAELCARGGLQDALQRAAEVEARLAARLVRRESDLTAYAQRVRLLEKEVHRLRAELVSISGSPLGDRATAPTLGADGDESAESASDRARTPSARDDDAAPSRAAQVPSDAATVRDVVAGERSPDGAVQRIDEAAPGAAPARASRFGAAKEWRRRRRKVATWRSDPERRALADAYRALERSDAFDEEFYLSRYRDVARAGVDPLLHFIEYGLRDRCDPNATFSTRAFLDAHPDVEAAGIGALVDAVLSARCPPAGASSQLRDAAQAVLEAVPRGATVLWIAGEPERPAVQQVEGRSFWSFSPSAAVGGSSPGGADGAASPIARLEAMRARGAGYLAISDGVTLLQPLREHIAQSYARVLSRPGLSVYSLAPRHRNRDARSSYRVAGSSAVDVIGMPIIDWSYRFQRPQQLLTQFARDGHRVFYLATTLQANRAQPIVIELAANVWGVRLAGPTGVNIYRDELDAQLCSHLIEQLAILREDAGIDAAFTIVDLPFWAPLAEAARLRWGWKLIYDCMDEHAGFVDEREPDSAGQRASIDRRERLLLGRSDLVLATSKRLHEKAAQIAPNAVLVPNAADFEHFNTPRPGPLPASLPRPVVGYYGAISSWFDSELVASAARARPEWSFVLAGSTAGAECAALEGLDNVHLLGELAYDAVPGLLHQFDVACIPFKLNDLTLATNPVKFYEYVSAGKPVVSVALPELAPYEGYYYAAADGGQLVEQVERALAEDSPQLRRQRVALGRANTWAARYAVIASELRAWYGKATVIITSFNNSTYLLMCLDSIESCTEYPNYEVIVVDNGSDQGLIDALTERCEHHPRLRFVANGRNLGFAAANNIGIAAASDSDYVVLLNDDTVVTRGWLGRLIGHLKDSEIGLVGPVTNHAGNEARIVVPYGDDLAGLADFAAMRAERHRGEVFDIPVAALFCAAMRRDALDRVGPLDERFKVGMFEDDDLAMRMRAAGLRVVCAEDVFIHHWGRSSFKRMSHEEYERVFEDNKRMFEKIWSQEWIPHKART